MSTVPSGSSPRLLLADDDEGNREVLAYYLRRQGFDVLAVSSGVAALEALEGNTFAVLVMDVVMPGLDGVEALRRIRARLGPAELPVILLSGLDAPEAFTAASDSGANGWLAKPYRLSDVLEAVRRQLASPTPLSEGPAQLDRADGDA